MIGLPALLLAVLFQPVDLALRLWGMLAQFNNTGGQSQPASLKQGIDIIVGLGWLVAAVLLLIITAFLLRKWLLRDDTTSAGTQFTMEDLRQMRDQGLMSPEEFDRAKKFLVSRGKALLVQEDEARPENDTSEVEAKQAPPTNTDQKPDAPDEPDAPDGPDGIGGTDESEKNPPV